METGKWVQCSPFLAHLSHWRSYDVHHKSNILLYTTSPKPLGGLSSNFTGMILKWSPFKGVQRIPFHAEFLLPWQPKEKNLKNLLFKNYWSDFNIMWYRWSLAMGDQSCSNYFDWMKNKAARGCGQFFKC